MKVLYQNTIIKAAIKFTVLFLLVFNSVKATKTFSILVPTSVTKACVRVQLLQGSVGKPVNVLEALLTFYKNKLVEFEHVLNVYNAFTLGSVASTVISDNVVTEIPDEIRNVICFQSGGKYALNLTVFKVLDPIKISIFNGIDEVKNTACCTWFNPFKNKKTADFLMTVELVGYILGKISDAVKLTGGKNSQSSEFICISIPVSMVKFK